MLRLTTAKTCVTWHNLAYAPGCNKPGLGLAVRRWLNALTSRRGMDARIAVSAAVAKHYVQALNLPEPIVIANAVPVAEIDAAVAGTAETSPVVKPSGERLRLVMPGRLVREKGHGVMVEALAMLAARGLEFEAIFAGGGPLESQIEEQVAAAGIAARVTFTGALQHAAMLTQMASADIVVVPSLFEGFGLTAVEAMTLRRAVVVSSAGGLTDVVEHEVSGLVVAPGDASALAGALWRLAHDQPERVRFGEAARKRVVEKFDAPKVAEATLQCYRLLAGAH
jgi:glycosyltransferase involved in cell wall biosynthesis